MKNSHSASFSIVIAIFFASLALKLLLIEPVAPSVFGDEYLYKQNVLSLWGEMVPYNPHYPPIYSLFLLPGLLTESWYDTFIYLNIFVSSFLIIAVWFLASELVSRRTAILCVVTAALLPFNFVYPSYLMSENLFYPLFVFAVALSVRGVQRAGYLNSFIFGAVLALCYLTKYLMLPAIPLMLFMWFLIPPREETHIRATEFICRGLFVLMGTCIIFGAWALYAAITGIPLLDAFGLNQIARYGGNPILPAIESTQASTSMMFWVVAYIFYFFLSIAPLAFNLIQSIILKVPSPLSLLTWTVPKIFMLFVAILTLGYLALAARHSSVVPYNIPTPSYIMGRYLMILPALFIVIFSMTSEFLLTSQKKITRGHIFGSALITIFVFVSAFIFLFSDIANQLPAWFTTSRFNSIDVFFYQNKSTALFILICAICIPALACLFHKDKTVRFTIIWFSAIFSYFGISYSIAGMPYKPLGGIYARALAESIHAGAVKSDEAVLIAVDGIDPAQINNGLLFWGINANNFDIRLLKDVRTNSPTTKYIIVGPKSYEGDEVYRSRLAGTNIRIYSVGAKHKSEISSASHVK